MQQDNGYQQPNAQVTQWGPTRTIICADCGRAIDNPAHLCMPLARDWRNDPLARDCDGGDLVPGWVDGPEYAADLRDQRKQDMR